jgi:hypothetical protein
MTKTNKTIFSLFGGVALIGALLIILFFSGTFSNPYSYRGHFLYIQHIDYEGDIYALFGDGSMDNCAAPGDPGWQVYKIENEIDPKILRIPCGTNTTELGEKEGGLELILSNYSEDGKDTRNPKIELLNDNFLVFSRGGYYYGLYGLENVETLINVWSPWSQYKDINDRRKNIHGKILEIINS